MARVSDAHLEARRRSILDAACQVFSSKGVEAATMAEIATMAGISPGAIYRYFPSKELLARGCMSESALSVQLEWKIEPKRDVPAMDEFAALSRATFKLLEEPGERIETLMFLESVLGAVRLGDHSMLDEIRTEHEEIAQAITTRLEAARAQGEFPAGRDPQRLAAALLAFYWGSRIARLVDPTADTSSWLDEVIELLRQASARPGS